jgi:hypothetical protein
VILGPVHARIVARSGESVAWPDRQRSREASRASSHGTSSERTSSRASSADRPAERAGKYAWTSTEPTIPMIAGSSIGAIASPIRVAISS